MGKLNRPDQITWNFLLFRTFAAEQKVDFTKSLLCWQSRKVCFSLSRPVKQEAQGGREGTDTSLGTKEGRKLSDAWHWSCVSVCVLVCEDASVLAWKCAGTTASCKLVSRYVLKLALFPLSQCINVQLHMSPPAFSHQEKVLFLSKIWVQYWGQ